MKRGASVAHVVYGGFAQDAAAASAASDPPGAEGEPLGDAFLIDGNMRWRALVPFGGVAPPPRGGHALVPIASNKAFVFGGRGADGAHLGAVVPSPPADASADAVVSPPHCEVVGLSGSTFTSKRPYTFDIIAKDAHGARKPSDYRC